jgi:hypothetical protein
MSAALALRAEAEASGVRLRPASGGGLKLSGGTPLELLGRLREHRAEILALLEAEATAVADIRRRADNALSPEALADEAELVVRGGPLP